MSCIHQPHATLAAQYLYDKFPGTGNDGFMAPFSTIIKRTWFMFDDACNAFQKASKVHVILTLLVIFLTCYTKPHLFLPIDYVLVSHCLPASQTFHAGSACQPLKRPTCLSSDIVGFCSPCLAVSLMPVFNSPSWKALFSRVIKNTLLESRPGWTKKLFFLVWPIWSSVWLFTKICPQWKTQWCMRLYYSENPARYLPLQQWAKSSVIPPLNDKPH